MTQFVGSQGLISQISLIEIDTGFIKLYWWASQSTQIDEGAKDDNECQQEDRPLIFIESSLVSMGDGMATPLLGCRLEGQSE